MDAITGAGDTVPAGRGEAQGSPSPAPAPLASVQALLRAYRAGDADPRAVVAEAHRRATTTEQPAWIAIVPWERVEQALERLDLLPRTLPLWGIPFAVKDNIDVAGMPTTAGCPGFARTPERSATAVERLVAAGAIPIGKTNMDQFATGLTGSRSPYGACWSVGDRALISGGSSSGSAVVVADGSVPFALGTDTAGSGRVPAALNGIVGLKPSPGLVSTRGVVPACRSLDQVSVFTRDVDDAACVLAVLAGPDDEDPYSRTTPAFPVPDGSGAPVVAVPDTASLRFFGDVHAEEAWRRAVERVADRGWRPEPVDLAPLFEVAALLYDGPWPAERHAAVGAFVDAHRDEVDPVVGAIIAGGAAPTAVELFAAQHRLAELARRARVLLAPFHALAVPTAPTTFTLAEAAEPSPRPSQVLGTYTNFANLLDLAALAVPADPRTDGRPFGITFVAGWGTDERLLALARAWAAPADPPLEPAPRSAGPPPAFPIAVVGAHLAGEPLNHQLTDLGGVLLEEARTSTEYRLFALPDTRPAKPGLVRLPDDPAPAGIAVELWGLDAAGFGRLVRGVPAPLAIGTVVLDDGRTVPGFVCEAWATTGAEDITHHGGWRAYRESCRTA